MEGEVHPRVLISYTHDSLGHKARVLDLSNRLIEEGVDCHIDQYVPFPPQGWPRWMLHELQDANFVLVVCTETYRRRALGYEEAGRGLGANWEGLVITQELYNAGALNTKFVPVVFSPEDAQFIPVFLQGYTFYNVATADGYDALYSLLTNQPQVVRPSLGQRRSVSAGVTPQLAPAAAQGTGQIPSPPQPRDERILVLLKQDDSAAYFIRAERIDEEENDTTLVLTPETAQDSAGLESLRGPHARQITVAHGFAAYRGSVESIARSQQSTADRWTIRIRRDDRNRGGFGMDVTFNGLSPDDQAEMRARRILLNDSASSGTGNKARFQDAMVEHYVAGEQYGVRITHSPFPELFRALGKDQALFIEAARLYAVMLLRMTNVVARIFRFDIHLVSDNQLSIVFEGQRQQVYSNVPGTEIRLQGTCSLNA
jgi:hypothetical protein